MRVVLISTKPPRADTDGGAAVSPSACFGRGFSRRIWQLPVPILLVLAETAKYLDQSFEGQSILHRTEGELFLEVAI